MTDVEPLIPHDPQEWMSRRRLLALGAITGGGLVATAVAACSPAASTGSWGYGPVLSAAPAAAPSVAAERVNRAGGLPRSVACSRGFSLSTGRRP